MGDIGFEEAERRRLEFAAKRGQRGGAAGNLQKYGSVFQRQGNHKNYMLEMAKNRLIEQAAMRKTVEAEVSIKNSTLEATQFEARRRRNRRRCMQISAVLPTVHRLMSFGLLVQLGMYGWVRWMGVGLFLLICAGCAQGRVVANQELARMKVMPKPEMTKDDDGNTVPRTMHDCHCPYSIVVEVEAARDLTAMDYSLMHGGTSDPYVIVKLMAHVRGRKKGSWKWIELDRRRTKTIEKDLAPRWSAIFEFSNERKFGSSALKLEFEINDEDLGGDDLIGHCSLPSLEFLEEGDGVYDDWEQIFALDGDEAGELLIRIGCKFTEEEAVRDAFERLDDDGSGELDIDEIAQLMETIGRNLNEKQLEKMMKEIDEDGSGLVEFDEYWSWWMKGVTAVKFPWRIAVLSGGCGAASLVTAWEYWSRTHLLDIVEESGRRAFDKIDEDGSGELDREEIGLLSKDLGKPLDEPALDAFMAEIDADGSGLVDYEEFFTWYSAGVDNTGLTAEEQREIHERAEDLATVNLLVVGSETIFMSLYHLYIGLLFNCFDHIDFKTNEGDSADDKFASGLSMSVSATVFVGFVSACFGWISYEIVHYPEFDVVSTHGIWTFVFRFSEMVSRIFTLAAFGCAWRAFTFLLVFIDVLIITTLNLCHLASGATLDKLEGDHVSGRTELFFALVSTVAYVGNPEKGLSSLCLQGAIVSPTAYYTFRVCEMGFMVLLWLFELHELAKMSINDNRTCYDQVLLLGTAGFWTAVLAISIPVLWYVDPRNPDRNGAIMPHTDGYPMGADGAEGAEGAQEEEEEEEEELWAKNDWESDSDDEGGDGGRPKPKPARPASVARSQGSKASSVAGGKLMMNDTASTIGWLPVDPGQDPTSPKRPLVVSSSDEDEAEEEYVPLTEEQLAKIPEHGFQRAIVSAMNDPDVPAKYKSRRIQQLVTRRNENQAEKKRAAEARKVTESELSKWGNPQLRALATQLGLDENASSGSGKVSKDEVKQAFVEADTDGGGTLDKEEIHRLAVALLGRMVKQEEVDKMMLEMDEDGGGDVDFEEFFAWYTSSSGSASSEMKQSLKKRAAGKSELINQIIASGFELDLDAIAAEQEAREAAAKAAREHEATVEAGRKAARAKEMAEIKAQLEEARKSGGEKQGGAANNTVSGRMRRMRRTSVAMLENDNDDGP
jgi:calmodulin